MSRKQTGVADKDASSGIVRKIRSFVDYLELSRLEMRKVTWPSAKETRTTSLAVLVFVIIMAAFLGLVDLALAKLVSLVIGS